MAWVPIHQSLTSHRKTIEVADALDLPEVYVVGHLTALWLWAMDNAPEGVLPSSDRIIARAAQWPGDAAQFVTALIEAGFVDVVEDDRIIHQWEEYGGKLLHRREANAERMREARAAQPKQPQKDTKNERATHMQRTLQKCVEPEKRREEESTEEYSPLTEDIHTENNTRGGGGVRAPAPETPETQTVKPPPPPPQSLNLSDIFVAEIVQVWKLDTNALRPRDLQEIPRQANWLREHDAQAGDVMQFYQRWAKVYPNRTVPKISQLQYEFDAVMKFQDPQVNPNGTHQPQSSALNGHYANPKQTVRQRAKAGDTEIERELLRRKQLEQHGPPLGRGRS